LSSEPCNRPNTSTNFSLLSPPQQQTGRAPFSGDADYVNNKHGESHALRSDELTVCGNSLPNKTNVGLVQMGGLPYALFLIEKHTKKYEKQWDLYKI